MRKNTKKYKILVLLAQGKSQSWIVKNKNYNKSVVCRYTKQFTDKRWLKCITPGCFVKHYRATPKAPITTEEKGKPIDAKSHEGVYRRIENKRWKIKILSEIKREITWDKTTPIKNGVKKQYLYFPQITIEKIGDTIILYPHKQLVDDAEFEKVDEVLFNEMTRVVTWLMKLLQCRCSFPPEEIEATEYASPILNPVIQRVLKRTGILIFGDCWIDCSKKGFVWGELESRDPEKLKTMEMLQWSDMDVPGRVSKCEQKIITIENKVQATLDKIEKLFSPPKNDLKDRDLISYG